MSEARSGDESRLVGWVTGLVAGCISDPAHGAGESMQQVRPRRTAWAHALLALLVGATALACSGNQPATTLPPPASGAAPTADPDPEIQAFGMPEGVDLGAGSSVVGPRVGGHLDFVSPVYTLDPAGPVPRPVIVRLRLDHALPSATQVLVATRQTASQPWVYQPGVLTRDLRHAEYTTKDLYDVGAVSFDVETARDGLESAVRSYLVAPPATAGSAGPSCAAHADALKDGYAAKSSKARTLLWCFGLENNQRVLKVTNRTATPVVVAHPGVPVVTPPAGAASLGGWRGILGSSDTLLPPGRTAVYDANLQPRTELAVSATSGPKDQSMMLLAAQVPAFVLSLTRFGAAPPDAAKTLAAVLAKPECSRSLGRSSEAILAACLSAATLTSAFGPPALLLNALVQKPAYRVFLRTQATALTAAAAGVAQRIVVSRVPTDFSGLSGNWSGPGRSLTVTSAGLVTETIHDSNGALVIRMTYGLQKPVTQAKVSSAQATLTSVRVGNRGMLNGPLPRVGQKGTITVRQGVVTPPYLRTNYCNAKTARQGTCR